MANILLQRGLQQDVDVTYKLAGETTAVDLTTGGFDAELVIRKKRGDSYQGQLIDVLRQGDTSGDGVSEADNRILFVDPAVGGNNIVLKWNTLQANRLPNEAVTVYGDLKITNSSNEVAHHIRLTFDILPEITA